MFDEEADEPDKSVNLTVYLISLFDGHRIRLRFDADWLAFNADFRTHTNEPRMIFIFTSLLELSLRGNLETKGERLR